MVILSLKMMRSFSLDYKTDHIYGEDGIEKIKQRYQGQLNLYQTALEQILK